MRELETFLRTAAPSLPWLPAWSRVLRGYEAEEGRLTPEGEAEMRAIGGRFRKRYARLLANETTKPTIAWSSSKERAVDSAAAFLDGYEAARRALAIQVAPSPAPAPTTHVLPEGEDHVVRYTKRHSAYIDFSARHKQAVFATLMSGHTTRASDIAGRMARKLGIPALRPELVRAIAEAAAFDNALGRQSSQFVRLLEPSDWPFLEAFDRAYRPVFEGCTRFRALAGPLVRDLATTLRAAKTGRAPVADLKFAHAQTLVPLLLLLGVEGNGLCPRRGEHVPGLSAMSPFAANFCVELFACNKSYDSKGYRKFLVRFRLHERYIAAVPALGEHGRDGIVPLDKLLDFFQEVIDEDTRYQQQQPRPAPTGEKNATASKGISTGITAKGSSTGISGAAPHGRAPLIGVVPSVVPVPAPTRALKQQVVE